MINLKNVKNYTKNFQWKEMKEQTIDSVGELLAPICVGTAGVVGLDLALESANVIAKHGLETGVSEIMQGIQYGLQYGTIFNFTAMTFIAVAGLMGSVALYSGAKKGHAKTVEVLNEKSL